MLIECRPGDQHRGTGISLNPFEDVKPLVSEYTAKEVATLSSRLEKQLGPEYISSRPGAAGQKVHYLAADKCINLANDVFGFNGWSSGIQNIQIDFVDESQSTGKVSLGLSVIVRVTLRDGTYHEDIGYGHIENCKGKAAAFEKAKKEGTTDALKRALRNFGNMLGNCIYDKEYVARVTKLKVAPSKWDPENLHRHSDYAAVRKNCIGSHAKQSDFTQIKKEALAEFEEIKTSDTSASLEDAEDNFGSDEFDEADFSVAHDDNPDEVQLDASTSLDDIQGQNSSIRKGQMPGPQIAPDRNSQQVRPPPGQRQNMTTGSASKPQNPLRVTDSNITMPPKPVELKVGLIQGQRKAEAFPRRQLERRENDCQPVSALQASHCVPLDIARALKSPPGSPDTRVNPERADAAPHNTPPPRSSGSAEYEAPVRFITARAVESVPNISALPMKDSAFNPHTESPSIRKTAGIDHTKTLPVGKDTVAASPIAMPPRSNFVNPQADKARRVGMPVGMASPLQARSSYKPPQIKRPVEMSMAQNLRQALGDVTSVTVNVTAEAGGDFKRQKTGNMGHVSGID
ncbi:DNA repair protein rad52 [Pseudocyphellaria aurata]|nr:DNA repair protein rad52 [Pseudocyphellaria aurata]